MKQAIARVLGGATVVAVLMGGTAACNRGTGLTVTGNSYCGYSIAFFGAITGPGSALNGDQNLAAKLAVEQFNAAHGRDCATAVPYDSRGSEEAAPDLARDAVANTNVLGLVGPGFSGEAAAVGSIFEEAGLPTITGSATRVSLTANGWTTFHRGVANDDAQGPAAAAYIATQLHPEAVFIVDDTSPYGQGLADLVDTALGPIVAGRATVTPETDPDTDFSDQVDAIVDSEATVVFYGGYYGHGGALRTQLDQAGWEGTLVAGDGVNNPAYVEGAGKAAAAGTVVTCPCAPASDDTFLAAFKARFGHDPSIYADTSYDVTNVFLRGIAAGNTTRAQLNDYLKTVVYDGVANTYVWDAAGELDSSRGFTARIWAFTFDADGNVLPQLEIPLA